MGKSGEKERGPGSAGANFSNWLQLAHLDLPQPQRQTVILKTNVAERRPILDLGMIELDFVDHLAIKFDGQLFALASDLHPVPFAGRPGGVPGGREAGDDATGIVVAELRILGLAK